MTTMKRVGALLGLCMLGSCQSLDVSNPNAPTLESSVNTPANVELTAAASFKYFWAQIQNDDPRQGVTLFPGVGLLGLADEITYAANTGLFNNVAGRPREVYDNAFAGAWFTRMPMANYYTAANGCADVIRAVNLRGIKLGTVNDQFPQGNHSQRAKWFCKFVQGVSHIQLGFLYDKALLVDDNVPFEDTDIYSTDHKTPTEVIAWGMQLLQQAIDSATVTCTATPTPPCIPNDPTPNTWANGVVYSNLDIIKLASSWKARAMLYGIRTDADWAATQTAGYWDRVIAYVDSGITSTIGGAAFSQPNGFVVQADNTIRGARTFTYAIVSNNAFSGTGTPSTTSGRISQEFLGPGDTTDAYLWWRAASDANNFQAMRDTTYESPDRRMPRYTQPLTSPTATPIAGTGTYFGRLSNLYPPTAANVPWGQTRYYNRRFQATTNYHITGLVSTMRPEEMDLIKAEALIRRNGAGDIDAAVALINRTRVNNGGLAALPNGMTQTSVIPGSAPGVAGPACVPRSFRDPTQCGTIMDALLWEKRLENSGIDATVNWADWRRFGMLRAGSMVSLPIHGRELYALGMPYYTYGALQPGSVGVAGTAYVTRGTPGDGTSPAWIH